MEAGCMPWHLNVNQAERPRSPSNSNSPRSMKKAKSQTPTEHEEKDLQKELGSIFQSNDNWTTVYKDFPRLAKRLEVSKEGKVISTYNEGQGLHNLVCQHLLAVAHELETPERAEEINQLLQRYVDSESHGADDQLVVAEILQAIDLSSKTARAFKCVQQNIIFSGAYFLKTQVLTDYMTKDVRSGDGWRVSLSFGHDGLFTLTHTRKEESVCLVPAPVGVVRDNTWKLTWELRLVFDKGLTELHSSTLRINSVEFGADVDADLKSKVNNLLARGNLIVSC
eukprot:Colp12_sorted_trinity150504_noHs@26138